MRQPISISHEKHEYQVIFRQRGGIRNLNYYAQAETAEDARRLARNYLAADTMRPVLEVGRSSDWIVAETNCLA